jgi:hypothetical protein
MSPIRSRRHHYSQRVVPLGCTSGAALEMAADA